MCGIVGIAGFMPVNQSIYDALTVLQHRGQDAAGIITIDANNCFRLRKANGLVNDVFEARHMQRLQGNMGIGHVRYPTAGSSSASEAQPFYVNSPYGITLAHNGNLTNAHELRKKLFEEKRRHINTTSDSEILLNVFASELDNFRHYPLEADNIFAAIAATNRLIRGAYACVAMIIGHGMVAFRDPNGIRPLVLGKRDVGDGRTEYMVASESVALDTLGFEFLRHIERTKMMIHVVDAAGIEGRNPIEDIYKINAELEAYNPEIAKRPQVIAANKTDLIYSEDEDPVELLKAEFEPKGIKVFPISGVSGKGIQELLYYVSEELQKIGTETVIFEQEFFPEDELIYEELPYTVEKVDDMYVVEGPKIEKMLGYTNLESEKGFAFFQRFLKDTGILEELEQAGIEEGDTVRMYGLHFTYYK